MKKIYKVLSIFFIILFSFIPVDKITAHAASNESFAVPYPYEITATSNVMVDLSSLDGFRTSKYNYSDVELYDVEIVALVETKQNDLIIYTFEPHHIGSEGNIQTIYNLSDFSNKYSTIFTPCHITSVNISKTIGDELSIRNYDLVLIKSYYSQFGVFSKFLVEDFEMSTDTIRYYEIPSIFSDLTPSGVAVSGNITEQSYKVASRFKFETQANGTINVEFVGTKVITVTSKYCGFVRYKNNNAPSWLNNSSCDSHFVAFSTDMQIDKLLEADVYYSSQTYEYYQTGGEYPTVQSNLGTKTSQYGYLDYTQNVVINNGNPLWFKGNHYEWDRIQSISEFLNSVSYDIVYEGSLFNTTVESKITNNGKTNLNNKQWVLRYTETNYSFENYAITREVRTICGDVVILRLKFETDGVIYNLGVVDSMTNEDPEPINNVTVTYSPGKIFNEAENIIEKVKDFIKKYWKIFLIVIVVILLFPVLLPIFPVIFNFITLILKSIIKIILIPFRLIMSLFNRKKK